MKTSLLAHVANKITDKLFIFTIEYKVYESELAQHNEDITAAFDDLEQYGEAKVIDTSWETKDD